MKKFLLAILTLTLVLCLLPVIYLGASAATNPMPIPEVSFTPSSPAEGMAFSQLTAKVDTRAVLQSIHVHDAKTNELVEGSFEHGKFYLIHYVLTPPEGREFKDRVHFGGGTYFDRQTDGSVIYEQPFNTCDYSLRVHLGINTTKNLYAGMKPEEFEITVPENSHFFVKSYTIWDLTNDTECETLQPGRDYQLRVTIVPDDNYSLHRSFMLTCNDYNMATTCCAAGAYGEATYKFSLNGGASLSVSKVPETIKRGGSMSLPGISTSNYSIKAWEIAWLDENLQPYPSPVTGATNYFEEGRTYYLTFKLKASNIFGAWENPNLQIKGVEYTYEVIDDRTLQVYIAYVPTLPMGDIAVTTYGVELGKPIADISATVSGNGVLSSIKVHDNNLGKTVKNGVFEKDHVYVISVVIQPAKGYHVHDSIVAIIDGEEDDWYEVTNGISFSRSFNTNKQISSAKLTISGVGLGKTISKVKVKAPSGVKYTIDDISLATTAPSGTTFKKGYCYYVHITLEADYKYCFSREATVTVSGKKASIVRFGRHDELLECVLEYSYVNEITKVSLPAMPKSITPGTTLPTNFKVSSSAKYTLTPLWMSMNTMETVTMANKNGCYILSYAVTAKDGCEFTEDTVFYVDGKKVKPVVLSAYYAQIMKPYNVGLTIVDRIDLTLPEPEHGAVPGEVTVPADAAYAVASVSWGFNTTGKLQDGGDTVTTFQNYKYHFLAVEIQTAPGYMFADKVSVFINGDKYTTLEDINLGVAYQTAVCFGKLGEIAKLTAPELRKDGLLLSWHGVPNADAYEVYRATSKSGKYTKVATVPETAWQDAAAAGKTYYYKVKAIFTPDTTKNSGYSNYVSIVYKCDAPVIAAVNGSTGKPVLSWEKVAGAKKYTVYRATSETGKYTKLGTTSKLTYTDSKAKAGSTYFYKIVANGSKSTYNSPYSNIVSCNVICGTPSVTLKLDAATGKPVLSWKKIDAAAGYRILRQLPGEEDFTVIAEQTALTFKDETAPIDTLCKYMVQTLGKTEELHGGLTKVLEIASGIARPSLKTGLDAQGKPQLSWEPIEGAVKYEIYRSTKSTKSYKLLTTLEAPGYTDDSVAPGKTYYYKLVAVGNVGKSAETAYVKLTGKCATPEIAAEVDYFSGRPVISWQKVTGAKKYTIYRATSETGKYKKLGTTTKLTYTDSKATVGKTYFYKIVANASSSKYNSGYSNLVSCTPTCAVPVIKAATAAATGKPVLSWKKVTGAVVYEIWLEQAGAMEQLASTTQLTFTDESIVPGETKIYWVYAVDALGRKAGEWAVATAACPQPKPTGKAGETGKPELTWEAVEGATRYVIYRSTSKSKGYKAIDETDALTFTDTTAKKGKTYYYKVAALCEETESAQSAYVKIKSK